MRRLKIDYRIEELFLKYGLLMSANMQRLARSSKNPGVIQKLKQISYQPKPDYFIWQNGDNVVRGRLHSNNF